MIDNSSDNIINVYAIKYGASKYIKHKLTELKGTMDNTKIIVGDLNTPLSVIETTKHKLKKDIDNWEHYQPLDLIDIYREISIIISSFKKLYDLPNFAPLLSSRSGIKDRESSLSVHVLYHCWSRYLTDNYHGILKIPQRKC